MTAQGYVVTDNHPAARYYSLHISSQQQKMRELLEDNDGTTDVSKIVGIALGVAGGVIILTGLLWYLYHRYGDLGGGLAGIPPERKVLVFTDLGKLPGSAQRSQTRPNTARPPSRGAIPAAAAAAAAPLPSPGSAASPRAGAATSRPGSAGGRVAAAGGSLLPALSVGLEAEPLPSTPGSIASPRGHGRVLFGTMDHPRTSNVGPSSGQSPAAAAAADESRPGSASTQQARGGSRGGTLDGGGGGGERPGSGGPGPRPSSSGSAAAAAARGRGALAVATGMGSPGRSGGGGSGGGGALPPALVPTGSVTTAWRGPPAPSELTPERSLNSLATAAATSSPVEAFDAGGGDSDGAAAAGTAAPRVIPRSGYGTVAVAAGAGRPPLPYRSSASGVSGSVTAAVVAAAAGSLAAAASGGVAASPIKSRVSYSRPGSGGDRTSTGGGADGGGGGAGGSPLPGPSWLRPGAGLRTARPSQGVGRPSGNGGPDDAASTVSGASSQFHSFTHYPVVDDTGPPPQPSPTHLHHQPQQQQQQQLPQPSFGGRAGSGGGGVADADAASGPANRLASLRLKQRARPAATTTPGGVCSPGAGRQALAAAERLTEGQSLGISATEYDSGGGGAAAAAAVVAVGMPPPRASPSLPVPPAAAASASAAVTLTVTAAAAPPPPRNGTAAAAAAAAREISAEPVESVESRRAVSSQGGGGAAAAAAGGGSSGNGASEVPKAPASLGTSGSGGGGEASTSPQHSSPTQTAWAAAVSLSSKLFRHGSFRGGSPPGQPEQIK
ncbi:hypothetical protein PLESTB_000631400 [Pleodorina starrii]|uniref:Uncharacterized protein n=1 Tax=Pleodorina starrii TaxID=330485 RepID=A0A9W6BHY0_9CHLO|nr:hypothetical protein PLESTB_000631400 [Pleodorina starrii]